MAAGLDFDVLRESDTWKAFGVGVVLFCIIGYASLSLFGLTSSIYGTSDDAVSYTHLTLPTSDLV